MSHLDNYRALLRRVDELCLATSSRQESQISCRAGCHACCRHLSVFAVEAQALREALDALGAAEASFIRQKAAASGPEDPCPLLEDGLCLLYCARPIICRTHGLPLLINRDGEELVDFCPENFRDLTRIPGTDVIDLERLNSVLAAVNAVFLSAVPGAERLSIARALSDREPTAGERQNTAKEKNKNAGKL